MSDVTEQGTEDPTEPTGLAETLAELRALGAEEAAWADALHHLAFAGLKAAKSGVAWRPDVPVDPSTTDLAVAAALLQQETDSRAALRMIHAACITTAAVCGIDSTPAP